MNTQQLSLEDMKEITLEGLIWLKNVCETHGLRYYLAYGTLLGAVRHKGFIPWDDDIDVWMLREDYDRLIQIASQAEDSSWQILSQKTQKKYLFPWAKVAHKQTVLEPSRFNNGFLYGISIDIFPLDGCPGGTLKEARENMMQLKAEYASRLRKIRPYSGGLEGIPNGFVQALKAAYYSCAQIIFGKLEDDLARWSDLQRSWKNTEYVSCALAPVPGVWPQAAFEDTEQLEFEKIPFAAPKDYDTILTMFYGDYMTLPPAEKRVTHHSFRAYWIDADGGR